MKLKGENIMEDKLKKFDPILVACTVAGFLGVDKFYKKSYVWGAVKLIFSTGSLVLFLTLGPGIKVLFAITLFLAILWSFLDLIFALASSYEINPFKYFSGGDEEEEDEEEEDMPPFKVPEPIVTTEAPMAPIKEEPPVVVPPVQETPAEPTPVVEEEPVKEEPVVEEKPEPVQEKPEPVQEKPVKEEKPKEQAPAFDENTYHIEENKDEKNPNYKKWGIRKEGSNRTMKYFDTQKDAIEQAKTMAENNDGSVYVQKRDGGYRKV